MAKLEEMRANVQLALQDGSFTADQIDAKINAGLVDASWYQLLSELESTGEFTTDPAANEVAIPPEWNFQRNLYHADVADKGDIKVFTQIGLLKKRVPNIDTEVISGDIVYLTTRNGKVVYSPSPSAPTVVKCGFYINPTPLVKDTDIPTCLPIPLHSPLLESYALWKFFAILEDGIEGYKVNTSYWKKEYNEALERIDDYIDEGQSTTDPVRESQWE
jgi:hypothetical protein